MWPVRGFDGVHLDGWERGETEKGVPYFIHHESEQTQWDHPLLISIMEEIMDLNNIKYAAYRTAMKIRILQKFVKLHLVTLPTMISVFDQHGLRLDNNEAHMTCDELEGVLADIFHVTKRDQSSIVDTELLSEISLNILVNFFDRDRNGMIKVSSAKVALTILCSARLQEKYKYLFRQFADHNNCITKKKFTELLTDLAQIPEYLSEKPSFGLALVNAAVDSCFAVDPSSSRFGITEEVFLGWLLRQPQTLVWISTLYRLATAETVNHEAKCSICKMTPIAGLRYQCLRCFHYDLCQHCFFTGQMSRGHKLKHPLQEYCHKSTSREGTKAIIKMIKNKLSKKTTSKNKQRYLPIVCNLPSQNAEESEEIRPDTVSLSRNNRDDVDIECCTSDTQREDGRLTSNQIASGVSRGLNSEQQRELESVIVNLEDENRLLLSEIEKLRSMPSSNGEQEALMLARQEALQDHNHQLELQLRRLRALLQYLQRTPMRNDLSKRPNCLHMESTPSSQHPCRANFNLLSPIDTGIVVEPLQHQQQQQPIWSRAFGGQSGYARRSLPQHLSLSPCSPSNNELLSFQHGQPSFQRSSARAILQSHEYSTRGTSATMTNSSSMMHHHNHQLQQRQQSYNDSKMYTFQINNSNNNSTSFDFESGLKSISYKPSSMIAHGGPGGKAGDADATAKGLFRIQAELDDIIRQLENVYPGCSLPHPCHQQQQQQNQTSSVPAANETTATPTECVGQNGSNIHHPVVSNYATSNGKAVKI